MTLLPLVGLAFLNIQLFSSKVTTTQSFTAMMSSKAIKSLPKLNAPDGSELSVDAITNKLQNKRVALYFSAGWCPMCTSLEDSGLIKFRTEKSISGQDVELIYVPSDKSVDETVKRTMVLDMMSVPYGKEADAMKSRFKIWAGIESGKLGTERRSGVPALVVLDSINGDELSFLPTEREGAKALLSWPIDNPNGIW
jgi:nucleoredoxin